MRGGLLLASLVTVASLAAAAAPAGEPEAAPPAAAPPPSLPLSLPLDPAPVVPVPFNPEADAKFAAECMVWAELYSESVLDGTFNVREDPGLWDDFELANHAGTYLEKAMEAIAARTGSEAARDLAAGTAAHYRAELAGARETPDPRARAALEQDLAGKVRGCAARATTWAAAEGWDRDDAGPGDPPAGEGKAAP